jgi:aryl-alcohol dehydrogenase-like predicted oxidoreductase
MFAWQFCKSLYMADLRGWTRFVSMQPHYNLLNREEEREMLRLCLAEGIGVLPWSPLARGRLTRALESGPTTERAEADEYGRTLYEATKDADRQVINRVCEISAGRGIPPAQTALAWLLHKPGVTAPIVGATKPHHLEDAVAALAVRLSEPEIKALEEPYVPHLVAGFE